jgi:hypothetical protein
MQVRNMTACIRLEKVLRQDWDSRQAGFLIGVARYLLALHMRCLGRRMTVQHKRVGMLG